MRDSQLENSFSISLVYFYLYGLYFQHLTRQKTYPPTRTLNLEMSSVYPLRTCFTEKLKGAISINLASVVCLFRNLGGFVSFFTVQSKFFFFFVELNWFNEILFKFYKLSSESFRKIAKSDLRLIFKLTKLKLFFSYKILPLRR